MNPQARSTHDVFPVNKMRTSRTTLTGYQFSNDTRFNPHLGKQLRKDAAKQAEQDQIEQERIKTEEEIMKEEKKKKVIIKLIVFLGITAIAKVIFD